jgi:hypothetical protein
MRKVDGWQTLPEKLTPQQGYRIWRWRLKAGVVA